MTEPSNDTVIQVNGIADAINQLAAQIRQQKKPGRKLITASISFPLSDLPEFSNHAGRHRDIKGIYALQKEINLAIGATFASAFTFASVESAARSVNVRDDLVTITANVGFRK